MSESPYEQELRVAVDAVRLAARLCRSVQGTVDPGTLQKDDQSPVTVADFGSQALICRALGRAFPDDPVIAEEGSRALRENEDAARRVLAAVHDVNVPCDLDALWGWIDRGGARDHAERCWTLDPIDGTKGFLRGDQYAVALALLVAGRPVLGVLGCPNLARPGSAGGPGGVLFFAVRGCGAFAADAAASSRPRRIAVSPTADPARLRICQSVERAHTDPGAAARIARALGVDVEPVGLDSQAKYGVVARGDAELYLRLPSVPGRREQIWDHAAGAAVLHEAGGTVTDVHGRPLDFGHGSRLVRNTGVVASNGPCHQRVLDVVRTVLDEDETPGGPVS